MSMYRTFALGADVCNAARSFLFSLGCIQALKCATNTCPTGITTQDPKLSWGLVSITTLFRHNLILSIFLISLVPYLLNSNIYGMYGCNNLLQDPSYKQVRVANFQRGTVDACVELMEATGVESWAKISSNHGTFFCLLLYNNSHVANTDSYY